MISRLTAPLLASLPVIITRGVMPCLFSSLRSNRLAAWALRRLRNQNIKHDPVLVDGTPEQMLLAGDGDHDLLEMPLVSGGRKAPPDLIGEILAELQRPLRNVS